VKVRSDISPFSFHLSHFTSNLSHFTSNLSHFTSNFSHFTSNFSHFTSNFSHFTVFRYFLLLLFFDVKEYKISWFYEHEEEKEYMKKFNIVTFPVLLLLLLGSTAGQWNQYDVPYVSTPYKVVEEMLRIAGVEKDDILYDLGCGDGRIVIMAAKNFGCRCVGVDLDPQRIKESRENAAEEGVENKVKFIQKDLFEVDVSEATVVTLYLLSSVNLKLRPRLMQQLKPGTRIVSHDFSMGEWEADIKKEVFVGSDKHNIYFWVVPADVSGTWRWTLPEGKKQVHYEMEITQEFNNAWVLLNLGRFKKSIEDFKLNGDRVSFVLKQDILKKDLVMSFEGQIKGDNIKGVVQYMNGEKKVINNWKARRGDYDS